MSYKIVLKIENYGDDFIILKMPKDKAYKDALKKQFLSFGDVVFCEFSKVRKKRSTGEKSQNHHLNGHIMQIMRELGMTTQKEYDQVKTEIKRIAHITFGYPADNSGHFFQSEKDCNSLECSWLIESAHLLAAELGITLIETE